MVHPMCGSGARWCARADAIFDVPDMHVLDVEIDDQQRLVLTIESGQLEAACPACRVMAAGLGGVRFHRQPEPSRNIAAAVSPGGVQHVHAGHVEHRVDARAVATRLHTARRRLSHRRGLSVTVCLVASDPEGPRPTSPETTRPRPPRRPHTPKTPKSRLTLMNVLIASGIGFTQVSMGNAEI